MGVVARELILPERMVSNWVKADQDGKLSLRCAVRFGQRSSHN